MAVMAAISPMPVIPGVSRARVIVRIRLGIRVVRALIVAVWVIIVARRIGITIARKSKTESPNPWKSRRDLSVSTPPGNEGQSAYRQSNQEKLLHRFTSSICFGFCLLFCAGRLRLPLSRNSDEVGFAAPSKDQNGDGFLMGLADHSEIRTVSAVATALWAVCLVWERASKWTGHRSAHRTDSSCGEPVPTPFMNPL